MKNGMRPIHPGEILREDYLVPLGMTPHALSKALHTRSLSGFPDCTCIESEQTIEPSLKADCQT